MSRFGFLRIFSLCILFSEFAAAKNCDLALSALSSEVNSEIKPLVDRMRHNLNNFKAEGRTLYLEVGEPLPLAQDRELISVIMANRVLQTAQEHGFSGKPEQLLRAPDLKSHYLVSMRNLQTEFVRVIKLVKELTKVLRRDAAFEILDSERYERFQRLGMKNLLFSLSAAAQRGAFEIGSYDHQRYFERTAIQMRLELQKSFLPRAIPSEYRELVGPADIRGRLIFLGLQLAQRDLKINAAQLALFLGDLNLRAHLEDEIPLFESDIFASAAKIARLIFDRVVQSEAQVGNFHFEDKAFDALVRTSLIRLGWIQKDKTDEAVNLFAAFANRFLLQMKMGVAPSNEEIQGQLARFVRMAYREKKGVSYENPQNSLSDEEILRIARQNFSSLPKLQKDYQESVVWSLRDQASPVEMLLMDESIQELLRRLYGRRKEAAKSAGLTPETREPGLLEAQAREDASRVKNMYEAALVREWIKSGFVNDELLQKSQMTRILDYAVQDLVAIDRYEIQHDRIKDELKDFWRAIYLATQVPEWVMLVEPVVIAKAERLSIELEPATLVPSRRATPIKPAKSPGKVEKISEPKPQPFATINPSEFAAVTLSNLIPESRESDRDYVAEMASQFLRTLQVTSSYDRDVTRGMINALASENFDWTKLSGVHFQIIQEWLEGFDLVADLKSRSISAQKARN